MKLLTKFKSSVKAEDYLHKIDSLFKEKAQKEIYMTYVMIFGSIFAFSYLLFWDTSENEFNENNKKIKEISNKIKQDNNFLRYNRKAKIRVLEKGIEDSKKELFLYKDNNDYIKSKIETISSLIYDERTWGEYLHSISLNAKKNNVKILHFTSENVDSKESFGHMLDISLKLTGKFKNILLFINSLEQNDLVVDVHTINMVATEKLEVELHLSVWGVIY